MAYHMLALLISSTLPRGSYEPKTTKHRTHKHSEQAIACTWWKWRRVTTSRTNNAHKAPSSNYISRCYYITTRAEPAYQHNYLSRLLSQSI